MHSSGGSASRSSKAESTPRHQIEKNPRGENNAAAGRIKNPQPEHKGFFPFLRHPFRKPAPKPAAADLRRPICKHKPCPCPTNGEGGGCVVSPATHANRRCQVGEYWNGGGCATLSLFRLNDCRELALALDQQARQVKIAESRRRISCSRDAADQECSELTAKSQGEAARYESLRQQYEQCRRQLFHGLQDMPGIN